MCEGSRPVYREGDFSGTGVLLRTLRGGLVCAEVVSRAAEVGGDEGEAVNIIILFSRRGILLYTSKRVCVDGVAVVVRVDTDSMGQHRSLAAHPFDPSPANSTQTRSQSQPANLLTTHLHLDLKRRSPLTSTTP